MTLGLVVAPIALSSPSTETRLSAQEQALARAVNAARAAADLPPLAIDAGLESAARAHTRALLDDSTFTHDLLRSDRSYPFETWIWWYFRGSCAGENLAEAPSLRAGDAVRMWLASPKHRANMLSTAFTRMGVELAAGNGTTIASGDFGC
jgi:uncharacterized protein YkwD